jgi:hypothetical protein
MDDALVTRSVRIRAKLRIWDRKTRKTRREHVLCYLRVVRWLGQATPSCQVLLQQRWTSACAQIMATRDQVMAARARRKIGERSNRPGWTSTWYS